MLSMMHFKVREEQDESGTFDTELDGMKGFIFIQSLWWNQTPQTVNDHKTALFAATIQMRL